MSRYIGPKCKQCRREGMKLFLKGPRCETVKCAIAKRAHPPGEHPWARKKRSEYGVQLREKQKAKRAYGLFERPFRRYMALAQRAPGNTGETLIRLLERRVDNAVYLLGFAHSRAHSRQLVAHGHVLVNGRRTKSPGYQLRQGDTIQIKADERLKKLTEVVIEATKGRDVPSWLQADAKELTGKVLDMPKRDEATIDLQEQLIVEFCSK
jgi:small subunit ribosomal protein S4